MGEAIAYYSREEAIRLKLAEVGLGTSRKQGLSGELPDQYGRRAPSLRKA